jgi:hypothetical protein
MEFRVAKIDEIRDQITSLLHDHYKEVIEYKDTLVNPNWEVYKILENSGALVIFVAEKDSKVVGYNCYIIQPLPQNVDQIIAQTEAFYLSPGCRGGRNSYRFLQFSENRLKELGADIIVAGVIPKRDYSSLLLHLGYTIAETLYSKRLT